MAAAESDLDLIFAALAKGGPEDAPRATGYAERVREQQRAWLRLSYRQRLDRLRQAKLFAARVLAAAKVRGKRPG